MKRKTKTLGDNLLALSGFLLALARIGARAIDNHNAGTRKTQHAQADALRLEALQIKNRLNQQKVYTEEHRTAKTSNDVVKGDLDIELKVLKIVETKYKHASQGISAPTFTADAYPEPGDVRRGKLPPQ